MSKVTSYWWPIIRPGRQYPFTSAFPRKHNPPIFLPGPGPSHISRTLGLSEVEVSKYSLDVVVHAECSQSDYLTQITEVHLSLPCTGEYLITPGLSGNPEVTALLSPLVSFTISDYLDVKAWANIFGSLPNLTHIHATEACAANLLYAIIDDCKGQVRAGGNRGDMSSLHGTREIVEGTREGGGQLGDVTSTSQFQPSTGWVPIFSQLEVIHIGKATFPESLVDLVYALTARKIAGKGIETLRITECINVDDLTFDVLGICVDELVWDREVLAEPEPEDEDDDTDHSESEYY
ncbi:hypothetical protein BDN72DRAFT_963906 [Pluteus cervinus]|uniref:Uncharacterized protein n=1 Tax=Pluteus cervinus TaxID=181527 RepID=A0ACD3ACP3_9AGAR|nr:hypothetical protein BDN72DRAFT_963906 [Pluteus cervinus]